jgi:hypothetical protein
VAEVPEIDGVEDVESAAVAAVLGVCRVGHAGQRQGVVIDAEVDGARALAAEVGDERVVGVQDGNGGALGKDPLPTVGDRLELAVAVELVAEEVAEEDRARAQFRRHLGQPQLVHLEQPQPAGDCLPRPGGREQRRGDATRHVGPGAVVDEGASVAREDAREHRGGRRLAVGGRDQDATVAQA